MTKEEKLTKRTCKIIKKKGRIFLKKGNWYLGSWTNIAAGLDSVCCGPRRDALDIFNLRWAFTIAPLYDCDVVVVYPKLKDSNE